MHLITMVVAFPLVFVGYFIYIFLKEFFEMVVWLLQVIDRKGK